MKNVLVTGSFGYLGLALVRDLCRDHNVVGFGHAPRVPAARGAIPGGVQIQEGDILDVERLFAGGTAYDAVIHLAGGGGPHRVAEDPTAAVRANLRGTSALIAAARAAGVHRLLFASTIAVYGTNRAPDRPYRETDEPRPDDLYGALKEAAEHVWTALGGGTSLRIANIYGAGCGVDTGIQGAVERFARAAASGGTLTVFGAGSQRIDYVHVDDVVAAFRRGLAAPTPPPVVNIGGGSPISIAELAERSASEGRALGRAPVIDRRPAPDGKVWPDRSLAIELAREALGWSPKVTYDAGLRELVAMMHAGETR